MRSRILALLAASVLGSTASLASVAAPAHAAAPGNRHVVVFGIDGARWDKFQSLNLPTIDGRSILTASTDPFDTKWSSPAARQDETGIPASTLGWTQFFPVGWTVDNSGMGSGGVTEWRGWTLTDDEFWTATQTGQDRENNVRARGVFAVAESDEWADKTFSGTYNTTLISPDIPVSGRTALPLSFVSHYLQEGNQRATVLISFDGGADQQLLQYSADAKSRVVGLTANVPAGAQNAKVKFRLSNANNNWYWVVDEPRFG